MVSNGTAKVKRVLPLRARKDEDKEARRQLILEEALALYRTTSYAEVKMADVAERSKLAKGTVFLYFPTKEALFLALLEDLLFAWFEKLEGLLSGGEGRWTGARVAHTVAESLEGEETLARLLARLQTVLEKRLAFLKPGEGGRFFIHLHALVTGLRQMADVSPVTREVLDPPHMALLRVDFTRELTDSLMTLLRGLETR